ncbi:MAG: FmdE family protein [Deltaproteobacteria bacterium]|jgi:formylmethanofuran dehydrogenase subunit E|nr:FmdE family protein [Deltaproteobacteria bacterium]
MPEYNWKNYLDKALAYHGHMCSGLILGLRLVLKGLELLDLNPDEPQRDLMIFIETNRCLADAAYVVTGITLGRRRIIVYDFGQAAMTFLSLNTNRAFRVAANSAIRPPKTEKDHAAFWSDYSDEEILSYQEVSVELKPENLPGKPLKRIRCPICGEDVTDGREVISNGQEICRCCAGQAYFKVIK